MIRIRSVKPLEDFRVRLEFTDGSEKTVDLEPYLCGPIFEPLRRDPALFRSVRVDPELGTIVWNNGADIDPEVLHDDLPPAWMEEDRNRAIREGIRRAQQIVRRYVPEGHSLSDELIAERRAEAERE
jgi:hypothetical protein